MSGQQPGPGWWQAPGGQGSRSSSYPQAGPATPPPGAPGGPGKSEKAGKGSRSRAFREWIQTTQGVISLLVSIAALGGGGAAIAANTGSSHNSSQISASQIANDVTGNTVNDSRHSGATVASATCYQNSVEQSGNGTAYAECDLTYSDGAVFRSAVTDDDGKASSQEQYQENLSASDIANYAVGDTVTSGINAGATVTSATCSTAQLESNDWTYATCELYLSDGAVLDATVADNGIRSEFQS